MKLSDLAIPAFGALCSIISGTWVVSTTYGSHPQRITVLEQQAEQSKLDHQNLGILEQQVKEAKQERQDLRSGLDYIKGQLQIIVNDVKRRKE